MSLTPNHTVSGTQSRAQSPSPVMSRLTKHHSRFAARRFMIYPQTTWMTRMMMHQSALMVTTPTQSSKPLLSPTLPFPPPSVPNSLKRQTLPASHPPALAVSLAHPIGTATSRHMLQPRHACMTTTTPHTLKQWPVPRKNTGEPQ